MRRRPLAAMLVLLSAALVLGGNALLDAGWGSALRSIADRVLPNPEIAMWAPAPEPGSHASSYADATGAGANYVYLITEHLHTLERYHCLIILCKIACKH